MGLIRVEEDTLSGTNCDLTVVTIFFNYYYDKS